MRSVSLLFFISAFLVFSQNGTLKNDFGLSGKMTLDIDDLDNLVGLISDGQGNTFFYGHTSDNQGGFYPYDFFIGKMDQYGNIDPSFGNGGISRGDFPGYEISSLTAAVYHDAHIYFTGQGSNSSSLDSLTLFIGKMQIDGLIDSSFADSGFFTDDLLGAYNPVDGLIIDSEERIVFCGSTTDDQGMQAELPLIGRLYLNGDPDSTFGTTGLVVYDYFQGSVINAMHIPTHELRHGDDGMYLSEIIEYNNAYFVAGKFLGALFSQLHVMSFSKTGTLNPNFISSGPFIFQVEPGSNHFLHDIAFDGSTFYMALETQNIYDGYHLIQQMDSSGTMGSCIKINESGYNMKTNFIEFWNGRLFYGGYHLDNTHIAPGYHSDDTRILCLDEGMNPIHSFEFNEDMATGDEQGAEDLVFHQTFAVTGGYMNNVSGDNYTDLYFMAFNVNDQLDMEELPSDLTFAPNPCSDQLFTSGPIGHFEFISMTGQVVFSGNATDQIDVSHLKSGVYFIRAEQLETPVKIIVE